jgi:hypothetical protein
VSEATVVTVTAGRAVGICTVETALRTTSSPVVSTEAAKALLVTTAEMEKGWPAGSSGP